jgi:predicted phage baseplate assembly protein
LPIAGWFEIPLDADDPPLCETVKLTLCERDGVERAWHPADHLADRGPGDRCFLVDRTRRLVTFGDGLTGRMPTLLPGDDPHASGPNVKLAYDASAGQAGNLGARARFENLANGWAATNPSEAIGGTDDETIDDARTRSAADLRRVTRAVLETDYVELAVTTPGVGIARAEAAIGAHPGFACLLVPGAVTVYIVPFAPRPASDAPDEDWDLAWVWAPVPDPGAIAAVTAVLDAARLVATELYVCPPMYRDVSIEVMLRGDPADPDALAIALQRRLRRFLDPLTGGDRGDGWPFGEPLRPSALIREAQAAIGDAADVVVVNLDVAGRIAQSACSDVPIAAHELPRLGEVTVDLDRVVTMTGGLR